MSRKDSTPVILSRRQRKRRSRGGGVVPPFKAPARRRVARYFFGSVARTALWATPLTFLLTACGLPSVPFLWPPENPGLEGVANQAILTFQHNPNNDIDDFLGYDIWYKFYLTTSAGEDLVRSDESAIDATPRSPGTGRLAQRGFRRAVALYRNPDGSLVSYDDRRVHIDLGPIGNRFTLELDLRQPFQRDPDPAPEDAEIVVTRVDTETVISGLRRRHTTTSITDPGSADDGYPTFWNQNRIETGQHDIYNSDLVPTESDTNELKIVLYALAVGIDRTDGTFRPFYSEPLRLEEAIIEFDIGS